MTRLKKLRKLNNETQEQIASLIGITRAAYSNIENGKRETDFKTLLILAQHFDVTTDYLLCNDPIDNEKPVPKTEDELNESFAKDFNRLTPEEQRMIHAQIKGLLSNRK